MKPEKISLYDQRWYQLGERVTVVAAFGTLMYFAAVSRSWLPGAAGPASSRLLLASMACFLASFVAKRRSLAVAIAVQVLAVLLLVLSIWALARAG
jgi:hypothetical protein